MSVPSFPSPPEGYTLNDSIAQIITSIAMEEIGLSHIINAEGEKLQYVLGTLEGQSPPTPPTIDQVLEVNESVKDMLGQVSFSQMFLMGKMQAALNAYQPELPTADIDNNILVAAGIGQTILVNNSQIDLPFASPLLQIGNYVDKPLTAGHLFNINADGSYMINYQMSVENMDGTADADSIRADLTSANLGVLDTILFPPPQQVLQQRSVTVNLKAGDRVWIHLQATAPDFAVFSQAITFVKVAQSNIHPNDVAEANLMG